MNSINGKYLKKLREEHGYSIRTFAQKIYSSKSSVQRWEQSFLPENEEILKSIANTFDLSVEEMRKNSDVLYGDIAIINEEEMPNLNIEQTEFQGLTNTVKWIVVIGVVAMVAAALMLLIH